MKLTKIMLEDLAFELQALLKDLMEATQDEHLHKKLSRMLLILNMLSGGGNYNESYSYDEYGNIVEHKVTGDIEFTVTYAYSDPANGILSSSVKEFKDTEGQIVIITKNYSYDEDGNIQSITTSETVQEEDDQQE